MNDAIELVFRFKADNIQELANLKKSFSGMKSEVRDGDQILQGFSKTLRDTESSFTGSILKANLLARGIIAVSSAMKDYVVDSAKYAARTDQLITVSDSLARLNGLSVTGVRQQSEEVRKLGITTQAAYEVTSRLIQARLDVSKAPQLARVAQDAAKIGGVNSSEALEKIITSIATGQVRPLHTMGLMVSFNQADQDYAAQHHKNAQALDSEEKAQARLQAVLKAGVGIYGTYEASLTSAGGQMQSLSRYTDELKNKFGEGLQPVMFSIIGLMRSMTTAATDNIDKFQGITAAAAAMAAGGTTFAATGFLPLPARAGVSLAAAATAYGITDQDPATTEIKVTCAALAEFDAKQRMYVLDHAAGRLSDETYHAFTDHAAEQRQMIGENAKVRLAAIYGQRQAQGEFVGDPSRLTEAERKNLAANGKDPVAYALALGYTTKSAYPAQVDLGGGFKYTQNELQHAFDVPAGANLTPAPIEDDEASQAFNEFVLSQGKTLRGEVNSASISLLSGSGRIAAQQAARRNELNIGLQKFGPMAHSPEANALYGLVNKAAGYETQKYNRDRAERSVTQSGDLQQGLLGINTTGRKKRPGDLDDANSSYKSAIATAKKLRGLDGDSDAYNDRVFSAAKSLATAQQRSAGDVASAQTDEQVSGVRNSTSLQLRLMGIGKTTANSGQLASGEYQVRIQAAAKEFSITGDIKQLRDDMSAAWSDKIISTAEREQQLTEKNKQDRVQMAESESQFQSKRASINKDPSDGFTPVIDTYKQQLAIALQIFDIQKEGGNEAAAAAELKMKSLEAEHDMVLSIDQLRKQERQDYENAAGTLFDQLISRSHGTPFRSMILNQVEGVGKKAAETIGGPWLQGLGLGNIIPGQTATDAQGNIALSPIGKILAGTPLGISQATLAARGVKNVGIHGTAADKAAASTDSNTVATDRNTDALDRLTARIAQLVGAGGGSAGLSAGIHSIGGPSWGGSTAQAYGVGVISPGFGAGGPSIPSISERISYPAFSGSGDQMPEYVGGISGLSTGGSDIGGGAAGNVAVNGISSDYGGMQTTYDGYAGIGDGDGSLDAPPPDLPNNLGQSPVDSSIVGPVASPGNSMLGNVALGVGAAGAGLAAFQDFNRGGVKNDISGVGAALGSAAAISAMIPGGQLVAMGLGIASAVTSMVPMLFGDPRQNFAKAQLNDLQDNHYFAPQQLSVNADVGGNLTSYGFKGNVRSSTYDANSFSVSPAHYDNTDNYSGPKQIIPGQVTPNYTGSPITVMASFVDPAGLAAHANNIADAVNTAMKGGHQINDTIGQLGH